LSVEEKSIRLLRENPICDHCLGRLFARYGRGLRNEDRGRSIKTVLTMEAHRMLSLPGMEVQAEQDLRALWVNGGFEPAKQALLYEGKEVEPQGRACMVCNGMMDRLAEAVQAALGSLHQIDYENFLVSTVGAEEIMKREEDLAVSYGLEGFESVKWEINREVGKAISAVTGKPVELKRPDVLVEVHPLSMTVSLKLSSIFVYGRYRKLERGMPQSKWLCSYCHGKGCAHCNYTGKKYPTSVEEEIANVLVPLAQGSGDKFHGAGREDVDARMLGDGRPFVMEILNPKKRRFDLSGAEREIKERSAGKVEVLGLRFVGPTMVQRVKGGEKSRKKYAGLIESEQEISEEDVRIINASFNNVEILQRTPTRVSRRRADIARKKTVYAFQVKKVGPNLLQFEAETEGGTYVKELISGDSGRTVPSVSGKIGKLLKCKELDVLGVEGQYESEGI